MIKKFMFNFM